MAMLVRETALISKTEGLTRRSLFLSVTVRQFYCYYFQREEKFYSPITIGLDISCDPT